MYKPTEMTMDKKLMKLKQLSNYLLNSFSKETWLQFEKETELNLGVIGSFMYARMQEIGSWNAPSTKVGFNLPSYSNLLNISCHIMSLHQNLRVKLRQFRL